MTSQTSTIVPAPLAGPAAHRDLHVTMVAHMPRKATWINQPFAFWAVGMVVAGRGTYRVNDGPQRRIEPGSLFAVYPGPTFHYGPEAGATWDEYCLCATGPGIQRWLDAGWFFADGSVRTLPATGDFVQMWRELMRILKRQQPGDADRASLLAERLMLELHHASSQSPADQTDQSVQAVLAHCRAHLSEGVDFHELARSHAMSYSLLRQQIRAITGLPPARYLAHLRCDAARELLTDTDLPIKAIAAAVGIADPYAFSRTFKRCTGLSPRQFRDEAAPWRSAGTVRNA